MRFKSITPVLRVPDMAKAIGFYVGVLGFQVAWQTEEDDGSANAMLDLHDCHLMLSTGAHLGGKPGMTGTLYFDMEGVNEYYAMIKDRVEVVWPIGDMDYGQREFGIHDCNGYTLAFAEALAS